MGPQKPGFCSKINCSQMILESKVVQKLNLETNVFNEKYSPKLIFLEEFFF